MPFSNAIYHFCKELLHVFFPPRCIGCREPFIPETPLWESMFCSTCCLSLCAVPRESCPVCALPYETATTAHVCELCRTSSPAFKRVYAPLAYGGALADAIAGYKYNGHTQQKHALAALLMSALPQSLKIDVIVPTPLDNKKLRRRGFNQSTLLAALVGRQRGWPVDFDTLFRHPQPDSQVGKTRRERFQNLSRAFWCTPHRLEGKTVLLIDDVVTTTATVRAAAHKLRTEAGAKEVLVACIARTP